MGRSDAPRRASCPRCSAFSATSAGRGHSDPGQRAYGTVGPSPDARAADTGPLCPCPPTYRADTRPLVRTHQRRGGPVSDQGAWLRALQCPASPLSWDAQNPHGARDRARGSEVCTPPLRLSWDRSDAVAGPSCEGRCPQERGWGCQGGSGYQLNVRSAHSDGRIANKLTLVTDARRGADVTLVCGSETGVTTASRAGRSWSRWGRPVIFLPTLDSPGAAARSRPLPSLGPP